MKRILFIGSTIVFISTLVFGTFVYYSNGCCWASVFNSSFGILNALFSGLAFASVIATLNWQRIDSSKKSFESNLYKQIEFFLHLVDNIYFRNTDGADPYERKGRDIFEWFYNHKRYFVNGRDDIYGMRMKLYEDPSYFHLDNASSVFESYFYYIFNIYEYIDHSELDINKEAYANQITALLTKYELLLLFYYVLGVQETISRQKMLNIIYKYHVFKNLRQEDLANQEHFKIVNIKAFHSE